MARSIHTTKKDLKLESYFSASDGVPYPTDITGLEHLTELERGHAKKLLFKDNELWRRAAEKKKFPFIGKLKLENGKIAYKLIKKRAPKPEQPTEDIPQNRKDT